MSAAPTQLHACDYRCPESEVSSALQHARSPLGCRTPLALLLEVGWAAFHVSCVGVQGSCLLGALCRGGAGTGWARLRMSRQFGQAAWIASKQAGSKVGCGLCLLLSGVVAVLLLPVGVP